MVYNVIYIILKLDPCGTVSKSTKSLETVASIVSRSAAPFEEGRRQRSSRDRSTSKYLEVPQSTSKYIKVPWSTSKLCSRRAADINTAAPEQGSSNWDSKWAPFSTRSFLQHLYLRQLATASEQWSLVARTAHSKGRRCVQNYLTWPDLTWPKVCNGAVVKEIGKSLVKVCTDGKVKLKPRKQVEFYLFFISWSTSMLHLGISI